MAVDDRSAIVTQTRTDKRRLAETGWRRKGGSLVRDYEFRDFYDAVAFLARIASVAEDHLHRPDMRILSYNRVRLTISNAPGAGLTTAEVRLAETVNALEIAPGAAGGQQPEPR